MKPFICVFCFLFYLHPVSVNLQDFGENDTKQLHTFLIVFVQALLLVVLLAFAWVFIHWQQKQVDS